MRRTWVIVAVLSFVTLLAGCFGGTDFGPEMRVAITTNPPDPKGGDTFKFCVTMTNEGGKGFYEWSYVAFEGVTERDRGDFAAAAIAKGAVTEQVCTEEIGPMGHGVEYKIDVAVKAGPQKGNWDNEVDRSKTICDGLECIL